jgi:hypothetical protein
VTAAYLTDTRYVRFMAGLPGLWGEVGALDDPDFLDALTCERQALGLVAIDYHRFRDGGQSKAARLPVRRVSRRARP